MNFGLGMRGPDGRPTVAATIRLVDAGEAAARLDAGWHCVLAASFEEARADLEPYAIAWADRPLTADHLITPRAPATTSRRAAAARPAAVPARPAPRKERPVPAAAKKKPSKKPAAKNVVTQAEDSTLVPPAKFEPAVPLARITPSPTNPRKHFAALDELAASIAEKGVLQPLVVRPAVGSGAEWMIEPPSEGSTVWYVSAVNAIGKLNRQNPCRSEDEAKAKLAENLAARRFELVAGERRYRAAKLAGVETVPVMIRELTDAQVVEVQVVENNQREDVHPLEEADGIAALARTGMDLPTIAAKLGRTEPYVAGRMQLTKLCKAARKLWLDGGHLNVGHAMLICRLPDDGQASLMKTIEQRFRYYGGEFRIPAAPELKKLIDEESTRPLAKAPWDKADATLVPNAGPCTTCPQQTGYARALFADLAAKDVRCLNPKCYAGKQQAFVELKVSALKSSGEAFVSVSTQYGNKRPKGAVAEYEVDEVSAKEAKKLKPEQLRTAIHLDGPEAGQTFLVRAEEVDELDKQKGKVSAGADRMAAERRREEEKAKRTREGNDRILAAAVDRLEDMDSALVLRVIAEGVWDRWWNDHKKLVAKRHGWTAKGGPRHGDMEKMAAEYLREGGVKAALTLLLECVLSRHVAVSTYNDASGKAMSDAGRELGVDVDAIRDAVKAEARAAKEAKRQKSVGVAKPAKAAARTAKRPPAPAVAVADKPEAAAVDDPPAPSRPPSITAAAISPPHARGVRKLDDDEPGAAAADSSTRAIVAGDPPKASAGDDFTEDPEIRQPADVGVTVEQLERADCLNRLLNAGRLRDGEVPSIQVVEVDGTEYAVVGKKRFVGRYCWRLLAVETAMTAKGKAGEPFTFRGADVASRALNNEFDGATVCVGEAWRVLVDVADTPPLYVADAAPAGKAAG